MTLGFLFATGVREFKEMTFEVTLSLEADVFERVGFRSILAEVAVEVRMSESPSDQLSEDVGCGRKWWIRR
jgi:hypothetical protein